MFICRADRIDGEGKVEGYYTYNLEEDVHFIQWNEYEVGVKFKRIDPQTLEVSFDNGGTWDSIDEVKLLLEIGRNFK